MEPPYAGVAESLFHFFEGHKYKYKYKYIFWWNFEVFWYIPIYSDLLQITILATIFCTLAGGGLGNLHIGGLGLVQYHVYCWHRYFTICNLHTGGPPPLVGGLGNPQNIELDTLLHCIGCDPSHLSLPINHFFTAENTSIFGKQIHMIWPKL